MAVARLMAVARSMAVTLYLSKEESVIPHSVVRVGHDGKVAAAAGEVAFTLPANASGWQRGGGR